MPILLYEVNAFTADGKNGQPAGVVLETNSLNDQQMLEITQAAGFTETAFVSDTDEDSEATYNLRFFSATRELDLCGHATIAAWVFLHQKGLVGPGDYTQQTRAGLLGMNIMDDGLVFMEQAKPILPETFTPSTILPMLGIDVADLHPTLRPQIVSTGIRDLFVAVKHKAVLDKISRDRQKIIDFSKQHNTSAVHVFSLYESRESIVSARNFAPIDGIEEEAATGTSNGGLLCYLRQHNALDPRSIYRMEQGETMGRLSYMYGKFATDGRVWIGGEAAIVNQQEISVN